MKKLTCVSNVVIENYTRQNPRQRRLTPVTSESNEDDTTAQRFLSDGSSPRILSRRTRIAENTTERGPAAAATFHILQGLLFNKKQRQLESRFWAPSGDRANRLPVEVLDSWIDSDGDFVTDDEHVDNENDNDDYSREMRSLLSDLDSLLTPTEMDFSHQLFESRREQDTLQNAFRELERNDKNLEPSKNVEKKCTIAFKLIKRVNTIGKHLAKNEVLDEMRCKILPREVGKGLKLTEDALSVEVFDLASGPLTGQSKASDSVACDLSVAEREAATILESLVKLDESKTIRGARRRKRLKKIITAQKSGVPATDRIACRYVVALCGKSCVVWDSVDIRSLRRVLLWAWTCPSGTDWRQLQRQSHQIVKLVRVAQEEEEDAAMPVLPVVPDVSIDSPVYMSDEGGSIVLDTAAVLARAHTDRPQLDAITGILIPEDVVALSESSIGFVTNWGRGRSLHDHIAEFGPLDDSTCKFYAVQVARLIDEWRMRVKDSIILPVCPSTIYLREAQVFIAAGPAVLFPPGGVEVMGWTLCEELLKEQQLGWDDWRGVAGVTLYTLAVLISFFPDNKQLFYYEGTPQEEDASVKTVTKGVTNYCGNSSSCGVSIDCDPSVFPAL